MVISSKAYDVSLVSSVRRDQGQSLLVNENKKSPHYFQLITFS